MEDPPKVDRTNEVIIIGAYGIDMYAVTHMFCIAMTVTFKRHHSVQNHAMCATSSVASN